MNVTLEHVSEKPGRQARAERAERLESVDATDGAKGAGFRGVKIDTPGKRRKQAKTQRCQNDTP